LFGHGPRGIVAVVATGIDSERGQASVELVAVLPAVLLVAAVVWQLALAGHTAWLTANAARAAARAEIVGRNGTAAARSALPRSLERGLEVKPLGGGRVRVSVRIPWLLTSSPTPIRVAAVSSLGSRQ
jgi:pilus assembly protein CpaE